MTDFPIEAYTIWIQVMGTTKGKSVMSVMSVMLERTNLFPGCPLESARLADASETYKFKMGCFRRSGARCGVKYECAMFSTHDAVKYRGISHGH
jgi:hypothetical protein